MKWGNADMRSKQCATPLQLSGLKVKTIKDSASEYRLAAPVPVIDEGSFYRIDGTYIIDKHKIKDVHEDGKKIEIVMQDGTMMLETV